jgi:L-lactate utilization protein LutC
VWLPASRITPRAAPSKTADIEQSLVIGAHGPKRFTLVLLDA